MICSFVGQGGRAGRQNPATHLGAFLHPGMELCDLVDSLSSAALSASLIGSYTTP